MIAGLCAAAVFLAVVHVMLRASERADRAISGALDDLDDPPGYDDDDPQTWAGAS